MGKGWEGTAARSSENKWGGTAAHDFGSRTQEDRGGAASAVGEAEGGEEGGIDLRTLLRVPTGEY
jgi:hypothetical protein